MENKERRIEAIISMDTMVRCINDENIFESWLMCGVADGDFNGDFEHDREVAADYTDDNTFQGLLSLFLRLMYKARVNGLYCDGILSDALKIKWE